MELEQLAPPPSPTALVTLEAHRTYGDGALSIAAVAERYGLSTGALQERFKRAGLPRRSGPETLRLRAKAAEPSRERLIEVLRTAAAQSSGRPLSYARYQEIRAAHHPDWPPGSGLATILGEGRWVKALACAGLSTVADVQRVEIAARQARIRELRASRLTAPQIAAELGTTAGAVYSEVHRMRRAGKLDS